MTPQLVPTQLADLRPWEYAARFAFGGTIAVLTGLIARVWGPAVAGLFLAFPAILPASLTLVNKHDGRRQAVDDARGARMGSIGLVVFGVIVAAGAGRLHPVLVMTIATAAWLAVNVGLWFVRFARR